MNDGRWHRISRLFHRAAALSGERRAEFLRRACRGDGELRREVESLLASHERPVAFLDQPALGPSFALDPGVLASGDPLLGRRIGAYRLDRQLGAGGMGSVYLASRQDGLLTHSVAIKVIHPWRGSRDRIERFQREAQALATLSHPHIARLLDAGVTPDGLPYLIMEHVDGRHIDAYCEGASSGVDARLELFRLVARAVHFAHQNLVIHRDLKPANIVVTADGVPKLLDFGIAVILEPGRAAEAAGAATGWIMTPDYASPEQLRGEAVTTATDVYSLGVVLYELLCGRRPHEPVREAMAGRRLPLDLAAIVAMAMREDPSERYASARQMADDLDRCLAGLPVAARPGTVRYRAWKLVRRHRLAVAAGALVVAAAAAGTAATAWQARVAAGERDRAEVARRQAAGDAEHARIEADSAQQMAEFLIDSLLVSAPERTAADLQRLRAVLERHVVKVRRQYAEQPHLRANLLDALGSVYVHLDLYDRADDLIGEAAAIREAEFGAQSLETALSLESLGKSRYRRGEYAAAAESFHRALELQRALPVGAHTDVARAANNLAVALRALGRLAESATLHAEALALRRRDLGEVHPLVAESLNNLGAIRMVEGDLETAERHVQSALGIRRVCLGEHHPLVGQTLNNLAAVHFRAGRIDAAAAAMRESVGVYRALGGTDPEGLAATLTNQAELLRLQGDTAAARDAVEEALHLRRERGERDPEVATTLLALAKLEDSLGRTDAAARCCAEALRIRRELLPAGHPAIANVLNDYGKMLLASGDPAGAEPMLREAVAIYARAEAAEPISLATAQANLGACLAAQRQFAAAETLLLAARGRLTGARAERAARHLRELYLAWGKPDRAAAVGAGK